MDPAVRVSGLSKRYGQYLAVDGVSFEVPRGEIFGLLGPNGAGKTSTLECLEGLRSPDAGQIDVMGVEPAREPARLARAIGVQLQSSGLPDTISVREAMALLCAYHGVAPRYELLERLGLGEKMGAQHHTLSTGQQRRLALALAVAHNPPVVFLDEPTAGLDVGSRSTLHEMMAELRAQGTTFILATHDMAEAEKMADRIAILLRGRIVASGTPREMTATGASFTKVSVRTERAGLLAPGLDFPEVARQTAGEEYAIYYSRRPGPTVAAILAYVEAQGDSLIDLRVERPSLEERFLEIVAGGQQ
ncbi:MAG: ABC transporter ATP-binding protein [Chloroflexota bacterium]